MDKGSHSKLTMAERLEIWKASKQSINQAEVESHRISPVELNEAVKRPRKSAELQSTKAHEPLQALVPSHTRGASPSHACQNSHPNLISKPLEVEKMRASLQATQAENKELTERLVKKDEAILELTQKLALMTAQKDLAFARSMMAQEDAQAQAFENSIQAQKIEELEQALSRDRMESSELMAGRSKKHSHELKRLAQERAEYEVRANQMIQDVNEQMSMLQKMAMDRIEELENELMEETSKSRRLEELLEASRSSARMGSRCSSPVPPQFSRIQEEADEDGEGEGEGEGEGDDSSETCCDDSTVTESINVGGADLEALEEEEDEQEEEEEEEEEEEAEEE